MPEINFHSKEALKHLYAFEQKVWKTHFLPIYSETNEYDYLIKVHNNIHFTLFFYIKNRERKKMCFAELMKEDRTAVTEEKNEFKLSLQWEL